jgi:hypothetical protein
MYKDTCLVAHWRIDRSPRDEDITSSDMTVLVTFDSKVKWFFIMSKCNTFDELMLHHDVCLILFSKVPMEGMQDQISWLGTKSKSSLCFSTWPPRHFSPRERKWQTPTCFGKYDSDCRTVPNWDGRRDPWCTPFGAYKYLLERLSCVLYNGSSLKSISARSQPQSSF